MPLEGSIKEFGLSEIFQLILVQQKTGIMSITRESSHASVGFVKGLIVSARVDGEAGMERVGEVLVRAKRVTPQQLEEAVKAQRDTGGYLGQILVARNAVSEVDLKRALRLQILETVYRLFRWKEGHYRFDQKDVDYPKDYLEPISTEHVLMEGVRRLDEWPSIENTIPSLSLVFSQVPEKRGEIEARGNSAATPAPSSATEEDPFADLDAEDEARFSPAETSVYHAVNGHDDVKRIMELVQLGEFEVCKALANLLTTGLIAPVGQSASAPEGPSEKSESSVRSGHDEQLHDVRIRLPTARWTANLVVIVSLLAVSGVLIWQHVPTMWATVTADLQAAKSLTLTNQVAGLQQLVRLWETQHGRIPDSLGQVITEYGSSALSLTDPWGRPWRYDVQSGRVSSLGPDGRPDTDQASP